MREKTVGILIEELELSDKFFELYKNFDDKNLILILSTLHSKLIELLNIMNEKLPTGNFYSYYPAKPSRELIFVIKKIDEIKKAAKNTNLSFEIDPYYSKIIEYCRKILKPKAGSSIQTNTAKIEIYSDKPIFIKQQ